MISTRSIMLRKPAVRLISNIQLSSPANRTFLTAKQIHFKPSTSVIQATRRYQSTESAVSTARDAKEEEKHIGKNHFFDPPPKSATRNISSTGTAWPHPEFSYKDMNNIQIAHRETETKSDAVALGAVRFARWAMDKVSGYKHPVEGVELPVHQQMTESKWLVRFVFLESVAAVPGMVGGMLRHLHSLRRMRRDNGWIESLLEEAFNERMHLLTFLKLYSPGIFMRALILGAQGVFFNGFFLAYLISPSTCHRFVGYLEEEAVMTYTRALADMDAGKLPLWQTLQSPQIAVSYWNMPEGKRGMRDLLLYVRADEAKHREVNHTLGNLEQASDPNPFVSEFVDPEKPHPGKGLEHVKGVGWARNEAL